MDKGVPEDLAVPIGNKMNELAKIDVFDNKIEKKTNYEFWIQTFSGRRFNIFNPHIDSIVIQDIAHSLSRICRFNGHIKADHYSVAQHSVLVSYICDIKDQFHGLLHDASEAYISDLGHPIKHSGLFENYIEVENNLQLAIYKRFGLKSLNEPDSVKMADKVLLATEAREFMSPIHPDWKFEYKPLPFKIEPLSPQEAEKLFMDRFNELFLRNEKNK